MKLCKLIINMLLLMYIWSNIYESEAQLMLRLKNIDKNEFDNFVVNHPTKSHFLQWLQPKPDLQFL